MGRKKKHKPKPGGPDQAAMQEEAYKNSPHTFVFHTGKVGKNILDLVKDLRQVMEPYTATRLKRSKRNSLKDFVSVAGLLHVTHFMILSKSETSITLKLLRLPRGPTITFKVHNYTLARDVRSAQKRQHVLPALYQHEPLLVMNSLNREQPEHRLTAAMLQNLYPSINVNKVNLGNIRRCVLFNYDKETKTLDFRHYAVRAVPVGVSRGVKKLIKNRVPDMGRFEDVSDFLQRGAELSESEAEQDGPHNEVELPQSLPSRGNIKSAKSAVRLTELGPRLTLQLVKIEEGLCTGKVMFHEFIVKTQQEIKHIEKRKAEKKRIKEERRSQQEKNVARKKAEKEEHRRKTGAKKVRPDDAGGAPEEPGAGDDVTADVSEEEDDAEYYRQEVGDEPEPELFLSTGKRKRGFDTGSGNRRKFARSAFRERSAGRGHVGQERHVRFAAGTKAATRDGPIRGEGDGPMRGGARVRGRRGRPMRGRGDGPKRDSKKEPITDRDGNAPIRTKKPKTIQQMLIDKKRQKLKKKEKQVSKKGYLKKKRYFE